ncbi:hypothetical protein [Bauldia litoralis]|uniref:Uncharacterized protein n=1 Tax=Bauldia litoralis TaxID=665467 RepID=A0A1G6EP65_9HYPH|nr:hypothetical protein [Bauldia litoralis]SDB58665.1 hypothetical protein SAMN02982931_04718 [Bauldia litoralis]
MTSGPDLVRSARPVLAAVAFAIVAAIAPHAHGQQPAKPAVKPPPELTWKFLQGRWKVSYWDAALSSISGEARISDRTITLSLRDHVNGEVRELLPERSTIENNELVLVLGPGSPRSERQTGLGYPEVAITVNSSALRQFRITGGTHELVQPMAPMPQTDVDRVEIRLKPATQSTLVGKWRYRVHPFIERAKDGYGRAGNLRQAEDDIWWEVGSEAWTRPKPKVFAAVPLEPQLAIRLFTDGTSQSAFGYPFGVRSSDGVRTRTLFVLGEDLPRDWSERAETISGSAGVTYAEIARLSDFQASERRRLDFPSDVAAHDRDLDPFTRGRKLIKARLKPEKSADVDERDAVILRATFTDKTVPGWQAFSYGGSRSAWLLQFGDNTAKLRIVRKIGLLDHEHEATGIVFPGELVRVEIETRRKLPVKSIPVIVGTAGQGRPIDPKSKSQGLLSGDGNGIPAIRSSENPRIFRTEFIQLDPRLPAGNAIHASKDRPHHTLPGATGVRVFATIGEPGIISLPPPITMATVYRSPGAQAVEGDWRKWLSVAARCADITISTRRDAEQATATEISTFLVNSGRYRIAFPGWIDNKVTVGQHAGMLLMRDTFVQQLAQVRTAYARLVTDEQILAFRRAIEPVIRQGRSPLTRIETKGIDGRPTTFDWTFEKAITGDVHDREMAEVERWAIAATREVIEKHLRLIEQATNRAKAIGECEVPELLQLTGYEFAAIARLAQTKLMRNAPAPLYWVPDAHARANVETVATVAERVAIAERLAAQARHEATLAVGLATIPVAVGGALTGSFGTVLASFAWDVIDVGAAVHTEVTAKLNADEAYRFARGAADLTGMYHLRRAERRQRPWGAVIGKLFPRAVLFAYGRLIDVPVLYEKFVVGLRTLQIARGRALMMQANGVAGAAEQAPARIASATEEVDNALTAARAAEASGGRINPVAELGEPPPGAGVDPEIENAISKAKPPEVELKPVGGNLEDALEDVVRYLDDIDASDFASQIDEAFLQELEAASRTLGQGADAPAWGAAVSEDSFALIRRLASLGRADVVELMDAASDRIAAQIDAAHLLRRQLARQVLISEPNINAERFEDIVDELFRRRPQARNSDYLEQSNPVRTDITDDLEGIGWRFELNESGNSAVYKIRDPDGKWGSVLRAYDPGTYTLTLKAAFRELRPTPKGGTPGPVRGMIEGVLPHPLPSGGVPTIQFTTMRLMTHLGVRYASAGAGAIRSCVMEHIQNLRTIARLEYLRRLFHPNISDLRDIPESAMSDMLMMTHSVRYAQSDLAAAGYRVKSARLEFDSWYGRSPLSVFEENFFSGFETAEEFIKRLGMNPDDLAGQSFIIRLDVEPIP